MASCLINNLEAFKNQQKFPTTFMSEEDDDDEDEDNEFKILRQKVNQLGLLKQQAMDPNSGKKVVNGAPNNEKMNLNLGNGNVGKKRNPNQKMSLTRNPVGIDQKTTAALKFNDNPHLGGGGGGEGNRGNDINAMNILSELNEQSTIMDQSPMMNSGYGVWPPRAAAQPLPPEDTTKFQSSQRPNYPSAKPGRSNWKGKNSDNRSEMRRKDPLGISNVASSGGGVYKPPNLNELQHQNHLKARRFYPKRKFNNRFAPYAPRNTTSFIIRAKKSGGIASLVSPCPVTPAILPTPNFSPSREFLVDMAKEEWGVDGYGSMKGLIRLRSSPGHEAEEEDENGGGSSDSDVVEHVEVERRLDHDLSRFEMIYPNGGDDHAITNILENRVDDQDTNIAHLEEENLTLKERIFLMERDLEDLRRRVVCLETNGGVLVRNNNDEASENVSENEEGGDVCSSEKSIADGNGD